MFHVANQSFAFGKSIRKTLFFSVKNNQVLPYTDISMVVPWRKDEIVHRHSIGSARIESKAIERRRNPVRIKERGNFAVGLLFDL